MRRKKYPYLHHGKNGYYYAYYQDLSGNRQRRSLKTRDELQAIAKFNRLLQDLDRGVLGFSRAPQTLPFSRAVDRFLTEGTGHLSKASILRHRQAFTNHLIPFFKKASVKTMGPKQVLRYIRRRLGEQAAPNTIHKELAALSAVFNYLVQEELVAFNPVLSVRKPKLRLVRPNYAPSHEELLKILNNLYPGARRFFLALCNSGCRIAELQKANIGDVELDRKVLQVVRKGGTKDVVPLNDVLVSVIEQELSVRPDAKTTDPLFVNNHGRRYKRITRSLATACRKAGIPHCTHHSLRHAYATLLHEKGVDIGAISKLLGHASPTVTQNIYVHWKDDRVREAAQTVQIGRKVLKSGSSESAE